MPATGDRITKRNDGLFQGMYTAQTPDGPKRKYIYGRRKKKDVERRLAEAVGDAGHRVRRGHAHRRAVTRLVALRKSKAARRRRQDDVQHIQTIRGDRREAPKARARPSQAQRRNPRRSPQAVRREERDS